jgi:hypothetical protein
MNGTIFINDKTWNINSVDVKFRQQLIDVEYKQIYSEIKPNAWLPISHDIKVETKLLGFRVHFQYLASLSKISLKTDSIVDQKIQKSLGQSKYQINNIKEELIAKKDGKELSKTESKINSIIKKEQLNKKETLQLVRLIKRQETEETNKSDNALEVTNNHVTEYDDSAYTTKDSIWNKIRQIPLSLEEVEIYASRDSLNLIISGDTIINKERRLIANIFVFNGFINTGNKSEKLQLPGLFRQLRINFNTVDGIIIDKTLFNYRKQYNKGKYFSVEPRIEFLFARKGTNKEIEFKSIYNAKKRAGLKANFGKVSEDYNHEKAISPSSNTISSLFMERNFSKIYQREFFKLEHSYDVKNGLVFTSSLNYENRIPRNNNSSFKLFNRKGISYTSNTPTNENITQDPILISNHQALVFNTSLSYTPHYFFKIKDEQKEMLYSNYPTFRLSYSQGLQGVFYTDSKFHLFEFSIEQSKPVRLIDQIGYMAGFGHFLGKAPNYFADYVGFSTNPNLFIQENSKNRFRLLDYYSFSSKTYYLEGHFTIEDNVLLLKRLPFLNKSNLTEMLNFNYLYTEQEKHFYEFGYGLKNILFLFDFEAYISFIDNKHDKSGFRLGIKF